MPIEKIPVADVPGWRVPRRKFKDSFREVAEALRDNDFEVAVKIPIKDLTQSTYTGLDLTRQLRASLQKYVVALGINKQADSRISVKVDEVYAYFFRFRVTPGSAKHSTRLCTVVEAQG